MRCTLTHITPDGHKSAIEPARVTNRGPANWRSQGLLRFGFGQGPEMVVVEGLEDALSAVVAGFPRVVAVGGVNGFGRARLPHDVDAIVIARDGDDPVAKEAANQALHRGIVRYLGQRLKVRITKTPLGRDANDIFRADGAAALKQLIDEARFDLGRFDPTAFLTELYRLDELSYGYAREAAAELLGLTLKTLDSDRTSTRKRWAETREKGDAESISEDLLPWPDPVPDVLPVLDVALAELQRYVVASRADVATAVIWACKQHLLPRKDLGVDVAERLGIQSAVKGSGKSTLLEGVANLVPKPVLAGSISASSLFRIVDTDGVSLMCDEADNLLQAASGSELLGILNSGHRRATAYVLRSVPTPEGGWTTQQFSTFAPIAFAGLKNLPETLQDRSIIIRMKRALKGERQAHLVNGYSPILVECRRKFMRWATDLNELPPARMHERLFNRVGDNWRFLLAVAQIAGGEWPDLIEKAALSALDEDDAGALIQLLEAIWNVFARRRVVRIYTKALVAELLKEDEGPWNTANRGRRSTPIGCGTSLRISCPLQANGNGERELTPSKRLLRGAPERRLGPIPPPTAPLRGQEI